MIINRERARLLEAIDLGRVTVSEGGAVILRAGMRNQSRVDAKVAELVLNGYAVKDDALAKYNLTDDGKQALADALAEQAAQRIQPQSR